MGKTPFCQSIHSFGRITASQDRKRLGSTPRLTNSSLEAFPILASGDSGSIRERAATGSGKTQSPITPFFMRYSFSRLSMFPMNGEQ